MNKKPVIYRCFTANPSFGFADAVSVLQEKCKSLSAGEFESEIGEELWNKKFAGPNNNEQRHCGSCHASNHGKHARTDKIIEPMAPYINPACLTSKNKIEKWLLQNCKRTIGRECSS